MQKIGILGGTFDPIHIGHMNIAYEAIYKLNLDKIIFMVAGNPPHKDKNKVSNEGVRYSLVLNAIEGERRFEISDYEMKTLGKSYTYKTLEAMKELYKDSEIYFITGADCLVDLKKWEKVESILKNCNFTVFKRPSYTKEEIEKEKQKIEDIYKVKITYLDIPVLDISSTYIRQKIKNDENVSYLMPYKVYDEIIKNHLYKDECDV